MSNASDDSTGTEIRNFKNFLRRGGKSNATVSAYTSDVQEFLEYLDEIGLELKQIDPFVLDAFRLSMQAAKGHKENSVRRKIIAVRLFLKQKFDHENAAGSFVAESFPIPKRDEQLNSLYSRISVEDMIAACSSQSELKTLRDQSLITLFAKHGLKASEILSLKFNDIIFFKSDCSLNIKGERARVLRLSLETAGLLQRYVASLREAFKTANIKKEEAHFFIAFRNRDLSSILTRMSRHGMKFAIYEIGEKVGLPQLSSEVLRNYFIHSQLLEGVSVQTLMAELGLKRPGLVAKHAKTLKIQLPRDSSTSNEQ